LLPARAALTVPGHFIFGVKSYARQGAALWVASKYFLVLFFNTAPLK